MLKTPPPVLGLIEIDEPANPTDLAPRQRLADGPARRLRIDAATTVQPEPRILKLRRPSDDIRRANLERLCEELDLEFVRVRRLLAEALRAMEG
ncbi:MAG: hypothetical protein K8T25_01000 [Planctomycetia bacterium]|nr:hypothetical protein [Planctomycetia bacterium]